MKAELNHAEAVKARTAALAHAKLWASDPFAYARMMLHLRGRLALASDVLADANRMLEARAAAKASHTQIED